MTPVVKQAHAHNVGISISVGGWSGSRYFSSLLSKSSSTFAKTIVNAVHEYSLDGVNIDWGRLGIKKNAQNQNSRY
jgi:chitinase